MIENVIAIYDNGGETIDRYTVVLKDKYKDFNLCIGMSSDLAFNQCGCCLIGEHLGKLITFSELPVNCQQALTVRLSDKEVIE